MICNSTIWSRQNRRVACAFPLICHRKAPRCKGDSAARPSVKGLTPALP